MVAFQVFTGGPKHSHLFIICVCLEIRGIRAASELHKGISLTTVENKVQAVCVRYYKYYILPKHTHTHTCTHTVGERRKFTRQMIEKHYQENQLTAWNAVENICRSEWVTLNQRVGGYPRDSSHWGGLQRNAV